MLLCKTGSQQAVCHCSYTYGDLLFIQVYSDQATKHCSKVQGKNAVSTVLCCSAKQAGSRQSVTAVTPMETIAYGDLLFVQLCSDLATKHCCKVQGKNAVYTVQCCSAKQAGSRQSVTAVTPMETCSSNRCAVTQQKALQQGSGQSAVYTVQCCSAKQAHSRQCVTAVTPMEICSSYRCAVTQQKALQQGSGQNAVSTVQCCSAKQAHSRQCVTAVTPMEICSSYRCAVTKQQSTAARFRAKCSFHCSVLLCKTGSQQAVCHCSYTYGDLLFIQVCSDLATKHCSKVQGKNAVSTVQCCCCCHCYYGDLALQNRLQQSSSKAAKMQFILFSVVTVLWRSCCYRCAVTQHKALQQGSGQNAVYTVHCSAKQAHSRQCVTAVTPMEICSSYRCAVTQQSTAARFRAKCSFHCSVLLCKTGSQQAVCHCSYTYGDLLFIQVCSDQATKHCSKVQGKNAVSTVQCCSAKQAHSRQCVTAVTPMEILLFIQVCSDPTQSTAARFRAKCSFHCSVLLCKTGSQQAVCHCSYTYGDLLFIQVCSDQATKHCSKVQGKMQFPLFSVALQNRLTAGSVSLQLHLWRLALHTGVQ